MGVLESIAKLPIFAGGEEGPLFVSIAAGMTTDSILRVLPAGTPLVRVMPNMPLMVVTFSVHTPVKSICFRLWQFQNIRLKSRRRDRSTQPLKRMDSTLL
jgi:hypothetical protein